MIAEQIGHIADHQPRQAAAHAGDVQQLLVGDPAFFLHIFLLDLGYDGPAAAKGVKANFKKIQKQFQCPAALGRGPLRLRFHGYASSMAFLKGEIPF